MMLENNHMKRRWNQQINEIDRLNSALDRVQSELNIATAKYQNLIMDGVGHE